MENGEIKSFETLTSNLKPQTSNLKLCNSLQFLRLFPQGSAISAQACCALCAQLVVSMDKYIIWLWHGACSYK
jgi:hypothetical protein